MVGFLQAGSTVVCGTAKAGAAFTILDATTQPLAIPIGTGAADSQGNFCVTVSPPLYRGQVIVAQDDNGTLSQPVIVGLQIYLKGVPSPDLLLPIALGRG